MKRSLFLILFLFTVVPAWGAPAQVEFVGELDSVIEQSPESSLLGVRLTPGFVINVRVTDLTEIRDGNDNPVGVGDLSPEQVLKVEGILVAEGVLAYEIKVVDGAFDFEVRGPITMIDAPYIQVFGLRILVPEEAEIKDSAGMTLMFEDLAVDQLVKVKGMRVEDELVARQIRVFVGDDLAKIRFEGTIEELSDEQMMVGLPGGGTVLVHLDLDTEIVGLPAVGLRVKVFGYINADLSVTARKIVVIKPFHVAPRRVRLEFLGSRQVEVVLEEPLEVDFEAMLSSDAPDIAGLEVGSLMIPAGSLSASFRVIAGSQPGRTLIHVVAVQPEAWAGIDCPVAVWVGEDIPKEFKLQWTPEVIRTAPKGEREVRLRINHEAPADLTIPITLLEGSPEFVAFPPEVMIPAGAKSAAVLLTFSGVPGRAKLLAELPEALGGDSDVLEIELGGRHDYAVRWRPHELKVRPNQEFEVGILLNRVADMAFTAEISVAEGDPALLVSVPTSVDFEAGKSAVRLPLQATAAMMEGRLRLRVTLPPSMGADSDDLLIRLGR